MYFKKMCRQRWIFLLIIVLIIIDVTNTSTGVCPSPCACKWKSGKRTVDCTERGLITIPENVDSETQMIYLSENNLQILPRETFNRSGLINLQRIHLRNCRIGQVDELAFRGLTNLIELDLANNLLTSIPTATFKDMPFLRDLIVSENPIQKIDSLAFKALHALVKLDLSNCEIQTVAPRAFEGIEMLELLKLNGNRLSELRPHTVQVLTRLHGVELHNNPWHCDCRLRSIKDWLVTYNIPHPESPVCRGGPERVIHKTFAEMHIDDFACKPEMLPVSRYIEAYSGENATIVCKVNAVPAPRIKWYWNGKLLVNNAAFSAYQKIYINEEGKQEKRSSLVLTNVQEPDTAEFYCVAGNRAGSSEANFTLHVTDRPSGISALGNAQIAGLSAALVILIILIIIIISVLLARLRRRIPFIETKTPGQGDIVTVVNGEDLTNGKSAVSPTNSLDETSSLSERKHPTELNFCNPIQKPPRLNEIPYSTAHYNGNGSIMTSSCFVSPSSNSGNNPDLINDTKMSEGGEVIPVPTGVQDHFDRPASGEYSRNADSLYPSGLWESVAEVYDGHLPTNSSGFLYNDKTPIMGDGTSAGGSIEELAFRMTQGTNHITGYPADYGLPIADMNLENTMSTSATQVNLPANAKTLRVWQRGAVPVLPPVTALKRALSHNRNSPDEGYQEGCGTDV